MVRGEGRLDVKLVQRDVMERAVRDPRNLRVGATSDPLSRARQYETGDSTRGIVFVGQFLYTQVGHLPTWKGHAAGLELPPPMWRC